MLGPAGLNSQRTPGYDDRDQLSAVPGYYAVALYVDNLTGDPEATQGLTVRAALSERESADGPVPRFRVDPTPLPGPVGGGPVTAYEAEAGPSPGGSAAGTDPSPPRAPPGGPDLTAVLVLGMLSAAFAGAGLLLLARARRG
ncbi:MAG: hypothetical protein R2731_08140 [Nocardioides sp.]